MRRRAKSGESSLDLFLDTICNTFGGIMFLAILLSVLVQMRSKEVPPVDPSSTPMSAAEVREVTARLDEISAAHSQLSEVLVEVRKLQPRPDDAAVQQLQAQVDAELAKLKGLVEQQTELSKKLAEQLETNAEMIEEMEAIKAQLLETQASLENDRTALDEALADQMEVLKLPKVESSNKTQIFLLMRYGRVFTLYESQSKELNKSDLVIKENTEDDFTAAPRSNRGWDLATDKSSLTKYLSNLSPYSYAIAIVVWPDSFDEFATVKEVLIESGFQYYLQPIVDIPACPFGRSSMLPRVQ